MADIPIDWFALTGTLVGKWEERKLVKEKKKINSICLKIYNLLEEPQKIFHKLKKFLKKIIPQKTVST